MNHSPPIAPPASAFSVTLTVTAGPHAGRSFVFDHHDAFVVGRAPESHFSLPDDPYFSRAHLLIEVNPPLCRLTDLRSKNGVLVNGAKVTEADLKDGDEVRGGRTALRVTVTRPPLPATLTETPATQLPVAPTLSTSDAVPLVPDYRIVRELGRGGMGVVYLAERVGSPDLVAVKTIKPAVAPTELALARFRREVAVLRQLAHPNIVAFRDSGEAGGMLYFAMEYVEGISAAELVRRDGPLPVARAVPLLCQVLDALSYAHAQGFVHRDVKPSNVLVTTDAAGHETAKLADFGLARAYQESAMSGLTLSGAAGGTPGFMPPEQILDFRTAKPAADQYAATATLYYLLSGEYPFGTCKRPEELFQKVLTGEPTPLTQRRADVPVELAKAVMRGLRARAEERFGDVVAMRDLFGGFA